MSVGILVAQTFVWMDRAWSPLPWWDQWETVAEYMRLKAGSPWWAELVRPHNEHRLVAVRPFFLLDYAWFGGANRLLLPMCAAIQLYHAAVLTLVARPRGDWRAWLREPAFLAFAVLSVALLLELGQMENLFWGFQIQFVGVFAAASTAFAILASAIERQKAGRPFALLFAAALALIGVTVFTMANGVLCGPIAVALALALRAPWRLTAMLAAATAAYLVIFFMGYAESAGGGGGTTEALRTHTWPVIQYVAVFIGGAFGPAMVTYELLQFQIPFGLAVGTIGLTLYAGAGARIALGDRDPRRLVLFAVMSFVVASALATAAGRVVAFGVIQALSSRYTTPSAVFWAAAFFYWLSAWRRPGPKNRAIEAAWVGLACLVLATVWSGQRNMIGVVIDWVSNLNWGADALLSDVPDPEALALITMKPEKAAKRAAFLRAEGLSIFRQPEATWVGKPLAEAAPASAPGRCLGAFDTLTDSPEVSGRALRATGWAWDLAHGHEARRIVMTDGRFNIVGLGTAGVRRKEIPGAFRQVRTARAGWRALARPGADNALHAFVVLEDGTACEIGRATTDRLIDQTPATAWGDAALGRIIPADAKGQGVVRPDAHPPALGPIAGPSYSSWVGDDANKGAITFGPMVSETGLITFGLATGQDTHRQLVEVIDAATGEPIHRMRPRPRGGWTKLAYPVPRGVSVKLVVTDAGDGFGEWFAVTTPRNGVARNRIAGADATSGGG